MADHPDPSDTHLDIARPVEVRVSDLNEAIRTVDAVVEGARRTLRIFSPTLEPRLYDRRVLGEQIGHFISISKYSQVQLLLSDSSSIVRNGHELIRLSHRFPSYISVRMTHQDDRGLEESWICADDSLSFFRGNYLYWDGIFSDADINALRLNERFHHMWERSGLDRNLQTFRL